MPAVVCASTIWLLELLDAVGSQPRGSRRRQCPAHRDSTPSLSVDDGYTGVTVLHCHAGCDPEAILAALHLTWPALRDPPATPPSRYVHDQQLRLRFPRLVTGGLSRAGGRGFRLESLHEYGERHVLERWRHPVTGAKRPFWSTRDDAGALIPGLRDADGDRLPVSRLPLYLERDIRMAVAARELVAVVESESSADALVHAGLAATTWAGGAARPNLRRLSEVLHRGRVLLIPDNDPAGLECGRAIWTALRDRTARLDWVLPPPGQDARDLVRRPRMRACRSSWYC
jgi:hypothetical protein